MMRKINKVQLNIIKTMEDLISAIRFCKKETGVV